MNKDNKFVVTDEGEFVDIFNNEKDANNYANCLARKNAIKDIQENQVDETEDISEKRIREWIVSRGTVEVRPATDEDMQELEENED